MKRQGIFGFLPFMVAFALVSCSGAGAIKGQWDGNSRTLNFSDEGFSILFADSRVILGLRGTYEIKGDKLTLDFNEYLTAEGEWVSTGGTELEGYAERIQYRIRAKTLTTYILNTGKSYTYEKARPERR